MADSVGDQPRFFRQLPGDDPILRISRPPDDVRVALVRGWSRLDVQPLQEDVLSHQVAVTPQRQFRSAHKLCAQDEDFGFLHSRRTEHADLSVLNPGHKCRVVRSSQGGPHVVAVAEIARDFLCRINSVIQAVNPSTSTRRGVPSHAGPTHQRSSGFRVARCPDQSSPSARSCPCP